jgi:hypothetical protein
VQWLTFSDGEFAKTNAGTILFTKTSDSKRASAIGLRNTKMRAPEGISIFPGYPVWKRRVRHAKNMLTDKLTKAASGDKLLIR